MNIHDIILTLKRLIERISREHEGLQSAEMKYNWQDLVLLIWLPTCTNVLADRRLIAKSSCEDLADCDCCSLGCLHVSL